MRAPPQRPVSGSASIPAPLGGWNGRDALADMEPTDAVFMTNWIPATSDVQLRLGYTKWATGLDGEVETILAYSGGSTNKQFAIAGGKIYDTSAGGAVGAPVVTGLSNSRSQYVNVANVAGNFIRTVNGADKSYLYDGTTWAQDGSGAPADITGVNSATLNNITLFKNRLWFTQNGSLNAWYLASAAVGGAATAFPLQGVAKMGGYLVSVATWTIDAGEGVDDYIAFVTSKGEVIVYEGTDPSSATTFFLKGVWLLGSPIGLRCLSKLGGDMLIICQDGLLPFSQALQSSRVNPRVALTDKIQWPTSEAISSYGANFGWQTLYFPKNNLLFLNVPVGVGSQQQFVMNTVTKSWCNFTGWNASCWEIYNDNPYFGSTGYVGKAWDTNMDNGNNIRGDVKQAFNYFKAPGLLKRWTMMRPIIASNGQPSYLAGINVDFENTDLSAPPNFAPITYAIWDTAIWDDSTWGGGLSILKYWQGVTGIGYCAAPRISIASQGIEVHWMSSDLVYERGAIL